MMMSVAFGDSNRIAQMYWQLDAVPNNTISKSSSTHFAFGNCAIECVCVFFSMSKYWDAFCYLSLLCVRVDIYLNGFEMNARLLFAWSKTPNIETHTRTSPSINQRNRRGTHSFCHFLSSIHQITVGGPITWCLWCFPFKRIFQTRNTAEEQSRKKMQKKKNQDKRKNKKKKQTIINICVWTCKLSHFVLSFSVRSISVFFFKFASSLFFLRSPTIPWSSNRLFSHCLPFSPSSFLYLLAPSISYKFCAHLAQNTNIQSNDNKEIK